MGIILKNMLQLLRWPFPHRRQHRLRFTGGKDLKVVLSRLRIRFRILKAPASMTVPPRSWCSAVAGKFAKTPALAGVAPYCGQDAIRHWRR